MVRHVAADTKKPQRRVAISYFRDLGSKKRGGEVISALSFRPLFLVRHRYAEQRFLDASSL